MARTLTTDVLVLGAGPAGSATASLLADMGHEVLVLDRARFPRHKPCAEYASPGAVRILQRLGAIDRLQPTQGRRLRGMQIVAPSGARHVVEYRRGTQTAWSLSVPRADLDLALVAEARTRGATVCEGSRAERLVLDKGRVVGVLGRDGDNDPIQVRARFVVGADGLRSVVVRDLGLRQAVWWPRRLGLVAHLRGVRWQGEVGEMHVGPRGYVGVAPLCDDVVSVGLVQPLVGGRLGHPEQALRAALADYPTLAKQLAPGVPDHPVQGIGPLAHRVSSAAGHGWLLVGDAAGFVDPFTGEGIYRALRSAELAAPLVDQSLRSADQAHIAAYHAARRTAFGAKEALTHLIQLCVHVPRLMDYAVERLRRRVDLARQLGNVLGDLSPAAGLLTPAYLGALLRP